MRGVNDCVYYTGDVALPTVDSVADLDVDYYNRLMFRQHIDEVVSKAALRAKLIPKCFQSRNVNLPTKPSVLLFDLS